MKPKDRNFLAFKEARDYVHSLNLKSYDEWIKYTKSNKKLPNIPTDPYGFYRSEWVNWGDWLGTFNIHGSLRKYKINDNFFKVWSEDMAYILGFWWADGFITSNQFSITQNKSDEYILNNILLSMSSNYPVKFHYRNNLRFLVKSEEIVKDIKLLGGTERKRDRCQFPLNIPHDCICHFVRGYFDGDGCINIYKKNKTVHCSFISSSKIFIEQLRDNIIKCIPCTKPHIYKRTAKIGSKVCEGYLKRDSITYVLVLFKKDSKKLKELMYRNANLYLKRKKDKFDSIFTHN